MKDKEPTRLQIEAAGEVKLRLAESMIEGLKSAARSLSRVDSLGAAAPPARISTD
jgi:hypothetical protein